MTYYTDPKPSVDEALAHYGVKGMRWGVRRDNSANGFDVYKDPDAPRFSKKTKILVGVGAVGTVAAGALLYKYGKMPVPRGQAEAMSAIRDHARATYNYAKQNAKNDPYGDWVKNRRAERKAWSTVEDGPNMRRNTNSTGTRDRFNDIVDGEIIKDHFERIGPLMRRPVAAIAA